MLRAPLLALLLALTIDTPARAVRAVDSGELLAQLGHARGEQVGGAASDRILTGLFAGQRQHLGAGHTMAHDQAGAGMSGQCAQLGIQAGQRAQEDEPD